MTDFSIIIVSFNTRAITRRCLVNLEKNFKKYPGDYEVIVVDNASQDSSQEMLKELEKNYPNLKVFLSNRNLGFGKANNLGVKKSTGKYILYLNSDAIVGDLDFRDLISLLERKKEIGALTVKLILLDGEVDPASHRGFPTIWRSFAYFIGLEKLFTKVPLLNQIFGGYHLTGRDLNTIHEIDSPSGAFFLTRKSLVDKIGGFDKAYFMYGEDLDMSFKIKQMCYKIIYYPLWQVLHLKYSSGLKKDSHTIKKKTRYHFYKSMKIFYQKHYEKKYPWFVNQFIYLAIDIKNKL